MSIRTTLYCFIVLFSICFSKISSSFAQEKFNITAGMGFPDYINLGFRIQVPQAQLGMSIGTLPVKDESIVTVSLDVLYHFGGYSKLSARKPWYARTGLLYFRNESTTTIEKLVLLNLRVGRDFNISRKVGIAFDIGPTFILFDQQKWKVPKTGWNIDLNLPAVPSAALYVFYRI